MRLACLYLLFVLALQAAKPDPLPATPADLAQGQKLFRTYCGLCHGPKGEGSRGPMLTHAKLSRAPDDAALVKILTEGIRGTEMPSAGGVMSDREIRQTAAYVRSLGRIDSRPVPGNPALGAALYRAKGNCTACHSLHGEGGVAGPDLTDIGERRSPEYLRNALINPEADLPEGYLLVTASPKSGPPVTGLRVNEDSFSIQLRDAAGRPHSFWKEDLAGIEKQRGKSGMPSFKSRLTEPELTDLIAYLASLKTPTTTPDRTVATMAVASPIVLSPINVPFERIRDAAKEPGNWLTYSRDYTGQRHSPLDQINAANVAKLHLAWMHQVNESDAFEVSPIVVDGTMFISEPGNAVSALDARTGRTLWRYERPAPSDLRLCCGKVNRGVAILGDTIYYGSVDAHLVALDARTGTLRWDVVMADYKKGYSSTGAPLAVHDKIVIGMAGGEFGVRGFIDAYDAKTGKRAWRFNTIPGKGEPGNETWSGNSWKTGAVTSWVTGVYDPETDTILWGTGNPGPDWNGDSRKGDNLYSDSLIALDPATGARKWHFQYTPHDVNDWDSTQTPILAETTINGTPRKVVALANRNGFYYVLDRTTGKFIEGRPYVKQTWASGLDEAGRPIRLPDSWPTEEGKLIWPSLGGGSNWYSSTFSPRTGLYYVNAKEQGAIYHKGAAEYKEGAPFNGGGQRDYKEEEPYGAVRALETATGKMRWEYRLHSPSHAGLMSTAGGLVFGSNASTFFALDDTKGALLWRFESGGIIDANPITFLTEGKQYVAIPAGHALLVFSVE